VTLDPRPGAVSLRLADVRRVVAVTGSKGGIGKSAVAATLAALLARDGGRVGLLDLDLTSPSAHVVLGFDTAFPQEPFGVEPTLHHGVRCMSVACFSRGAAAPLRGGDVTNAILELLAITRWGALDLLVLDMPPGLGDAALDVLRLLGRAEQLVLATSSRVVLESVDRALGLLGRVSARCLGLLENLRREPTGAVADLARRRGVPFLGALPYDPGLEAALGDVPRLLETPFAAALAAAAVKGGLRDAD
jgi:ATP-binding protein involved in chromosome partitioning